MNDPIIERHISKSIRSVYKLLVEAQALQKHYEPDKIKDLERHIKRLQSALDIIDGTKTARFSAHAKELHKQGKLNSKGSKLEKHHDRIVDAVNTNGNLSELAEELSVSRSTVYRYINKYIGKYSLK